MGTCNDVSPWDMHHVYKEIARQRKVQKLRLTLFLVCIIGLSVFAGCCNASDKWFVADDWSKPDTYRQASYTALLIVDCAQTLKFRDDPNIFETNPLLDEEPKPKDIYRMCALNWIGHYAISNLLPAHSTKWWVPDRSTFQNITIGIELGAIYRNQSIIMRISKRH